MKVIKNFECNIYKIDDKNVEARNMIGNSWHRFLTTSRHMNHTERQILKELENCKRFLRQNDDVFVTKADKGQFTMIMDKNSYFNQMTKLLTDETAIEKRSHKKDK